MRLEYALAVALVAVCVAWAVTFVLGRRNHAAAMQRQQDLEARLDHATVRDETTGLLNEAGGRMVADRIVHIAHRDSDAVTCAVVQVLPRSPGTAVTTDDLLTLAEAAMVVFRAGDALARMADDRVLMVGKGPALDPNSVESRLEAQMARMVAPGDPVPTIMAGCAHLPPWEPADLEHLLGRACTELELRGAARY